MTPTPELYVANPVLDGAVATETTVYVARCPHEGCHHAPDHGDPQVALDAVMGHWQREHGREAATARFLRSVMEPSPETLIPPHSAMEEVAATGDREFFKRPLVGRALTSAEVSEGVEFAKPIGGGPKYAVRTLDADELRYRRLAR